MKMVYCRHCRKDVPMLDDYEREQVMQLYTTCVKAVKQYRQEHNTSLAETPLSELYKPVRELIKEITGSDEFDLDEVIQRHYVSRWK